MTDADRTARIQGLHDLATALELNSTLPLPYEVSSENTRLAFFVHRDLQQALAMRTLMTDAVTEHHASVDFPVSIRGILYGLPVAVYVGAKAALAKEAPVPQWPACDPRLGLDADQAAS